MVNRHHLLIRFGGYFLVLYLRLWQRSDRSTVQDGEGGSGAAERRLVLRRGPKSRAAPPGAGRQPSGSPGRRADPLEGNSGRGSARRGSSSSRNLSLGTQTPCFGSRAGCPAQPPCVQLKALEGGSEQNPEVGPEKTGPGLRQRKLRVKETTAVWGHPGVIPGDCVVTSV